MNPNPKIPRAVVQVHIYLSEESSGLSQDSSKSSPCCCCNGVKARCKFCVRAKTKLPCFGCHLPGMGGATIPLHRHLLHNCPHLIVYQFHSSHHRLSLLNSRRQLLCTDSSCLHCLIPPRNHKPPTLHWGFV